MSKIGTSGKAIIHGLVILGWRMDLDQILNTDNIYLEIRADTILGQSNYWSRQSILTKNPHWWSILGNKYHTWDPRVFNPTSIPARGRLYLLISPWIPVNPASNLRLVIVVVCPVTKKLWLESRHQNTHTTSGQSVHVQQASSNTHSVIVCTCIRTCCG